MLLTTFKLEFHVKCSKTQIEVIFVVLERMGTADSWTDDCSYWNCELKLSIFHWVSLVVFQKLCNEANFKLHWLFWKFQAWDTWPSRSTTAIWLISLKTTRKSSAARFPTVITTSEIFLVQLWTAYTFTYKTSLIFESEKFGECCKFLTGCILRLYEELFSCDFVLNFSPLTFMFFWGKSWLSGV